MNSNNDGVSGSQGGSRMIPRLSAEDLKQVKESVTDEMMERKLLKIRYIGVEFDPKKITNCEDEVNIALEGGYQPITDYPTPLGLVMVLGLWNRSKRAEKPPQ